MEIIATSVSNALTEGLYFLHAWGDPEPSRNGPVLVAPRPITTIYRNPTRRVLASPLRDANPFFHLMEALWMLAGRRDIAWPKFFNSRFGEYSDDGINQHAAYGYRWRYHFEVDQIQAVIDELSRDRGSRRAVIIMSDPVADLPALYNKGVDLPCNTGIYFDLRGGRLNMTVTNRSNDIIWGAYGANAVHMSILQEYIAFALNAPIGEYRQFSNNYHIYTSVVPKEKMIDMARDVNITDPYRGGVEPLPLISTDLEHWNSDLDLFMKDPLSDPDDFYDPFFSGVASPMYAAWYRRKNKYNRGDVLEYAQKIEAPDWKKACVEWLDRRYAVSVAPRPGEEAESHDL